MLSSKFELDYEHIRDYLSDLRKHNITELASEVVYDQIWLSASRRWLRLVTEENEFSQDKAEKLLSCWVSSSLDGSPPPVIQVSSRQAIGAVHAALLLYSHFEFGDPPPNLSDLTLTPVVWKEVKDIIRRHVPSRDHPGLPTPATEMLIDVGSGRKSYAVALDQLTRTYEQTVVKARDLYDLSSISGEETDEPITMAHVEFLVSLRRIEESDIPQDIQHLMSVASTVGGFSMSTIGVLYTPNPT